MKELREKAERFDRFTRSLPAMLYDYIFNHDGISYCLYCSAYSLELLGIPLKIFWRI